MPDIKKFKMLSDTEHVLLRPSRYIGSVNPHPIDTETYSIQKNAFKREKLSYIPAFIKVFDEIITNSVDFSKEPEGQHLNTIMVTVSRMTGEISVWDNGGIPVVQHPDYQDIWIPDMIFGHLRSGSNFDDNADSESAGQNGEGASLTNIFSDQFRVQTADGANNYEQLYSANMTQRTDAIIKPFLGRYTRISYIPDYKRFNMQGLDDAAFAMLERRVAEIKACNPRLTVKFNNEEVKFKCFEEYATTMAGPVVADVQKKWEVCLAHSTEGFKHHSFVNSTATYTGGVHVEYVADKIVDRIREHIEKKTKQKIKPSDIRNHFHLFINCTINNPRYDSQTKVNLITEVSSFGNSYTPDPKFIKKIIASPVVQAIIEWAERKQIDDEQGKLDAKGKDSDRMKFADIEKYEPAESDDRSKCTLFVMEGDSAKNTLLSARNPDFHGIYPLKGKPINALEASMREMLQNKEFSELMSILGLRLGHKADVNKLRYRRVAVAADNDLDGFHIFGIKCANFFKHWPELFEQQFFYRLETPLILVECGKQKLEFFDKRGFDVWAATNTEKYSYDYKKGLGSHNTTEFVKYMNDEAYLSRVTMDTPEDVEALNTAFLKDRAHDRKIWLFGENFGK